MVEIAFNCLAAAAFTMAFSLPVGRVFLGAAIVLVIINCLRRREVPRIAPITWFMALFVIAAVISTMAGLDPGGTWHNLRKLLWFFAIPVFAILVVTPSQMSDILGAYTAGTGVLAAYDLVRNPIVAFKMYKAGEGASFYDVLVSLGSMSDGQRLMVGILATLGFLVLYRKEGKRTIGWWILLVVQALGLLISFKRGSLICLLVVVAAFVALMTSWRYVLILAAVAAVVVLLPPVRTRLATLTTEFDMSKGGRATMWFKIAPALHKEYPWLGVGWRAMTEDLMRNTAEEAGVKVEARRTHLHSNIAEVLVETGWIGFIFYALWMLKAMIDSFRYARGARRRSPEESFGAKILFAMLMALLLNGLVEFNFADGEIVLIYAMIMGCAAAGLERLEFRPSGIGLMLK